MCKLQNIKDSEFIIYHLKDVNYIGITANLKKRLIKHKNKSKYNIAQENVDVLYVTNDLNDGLSKELELQNKYNCKVGVRNQSGSKNPYAKTVLHSTTGIFYDTIKDACEALNYSYSNARHLVRNTNNKYNLIRL